MQPHAYWVPLSLNTNTSIQCTYDTALTLKCVLGSSFIEGPSTPPAYLASEEMVLEMSIAVNDEEEVFSTPMLSALIGTK
jgi:hypothetical protein